MMLQIGFIISLSLLAMIGLIFIISKVKDNNTTTNILVTVIFLLIMYTAFMVSMAVSYDINGSGYKKIYNTGVKDTHLKYEKVIFKSYTILSQVSNDERYYDDRDELWLNKDKMKIKIDTIYIKNEK